MTVPGFFTSGRIQNDRIWLWKKHIDRFYATINRLGWEIACDDACLKQKLVHEFEKSNLTQARFRIVHNGKEVSIEVHPNHQKSVLNAELRKAESPQSYRSGIKSIDKSMYTFKDTSADVVLMYTDLGLSEFNIGNVVFQSEDRFTTPLRDLGFSGIGLSIFQEFLSHSGMSLEMNTLSPKYLAKSHTIWLVNAVRGLVKTNFTSENSSSLSSKEERLVNQVDEFFENHSSSVSL